MIEKRRGILMNSSSFSVFSSRKCRSFSFLFSHGGEEEMRGGGGRGGIKSRAFFSLPRTSSPPLNKIVHSSNDIINTKFGNKRNACLLGGMHTANFHSLFNKNINNKNISLSQLINRKRCASSSSSASSTFPPYSTSSFPIFFAKTKRSFSSSSSSSSSSSPSSSAKQSSSSPTPPPSSSPPSPPPPREIYKRESWPIKKLLIANRGEISVRITRACKEIGVKTVGIHSMEDARSLHRLVADEAYVVGRGMSPVAAYLNGDEIIRIAKAHGVDAIHPGYGFLSENAQFAQQVESAGIMWVGPAPEVVGRMGDKILARRTAVEADVPVIPGTNAPIEHIEECIEVCKKIGYPVMLKAAYGGGGRGMRRVFSETEVKEAFERATSEAKSAFGNGAMFVEKLVEGGQHIEVQIVGDSDGNVVHLHERDCTIQRRHQKVIEIAPAPFLNNKRREEILKHAIQIAKYVGYENAGTVEFLVDGTRHYFIEVNARLQVEHTVSEEITGIDLVKTQIRLREGKTLNDLNIKQNIINKCLLKSEENGNINESVVVGPVCIQCRITTEDSQRNFQPSTGRIDLYQPATGPGIRLDGAIAASGAVVTPHYDSLLVKLIAKGNTFREAVARADRGLRETRIRGVCTNIPFILNVLSHPKFLDGTATVRFIDDHPELLYYDPLDLSSQNICKYLAEVIVNGPMSPLVNTDRLPDRKKADPPPLPANVGGGGGFMSNNLFTSGGGSWAGPPEDFELKGISALSKSAPKGYKQLLDEVGPEGFKKVIRSEKCLLLTDTTLRDAHQSLFATRLRTIDMLKCAPSYAHLLPHLFSLENWGGATFDVAYRFLYESPWRRLELLREAIPNIPFQMLLRGANGVGYTAYPDNVVHKFCSEAVHYGMDIFRVFDCLNYIDNLQLGIQAAGSAGGVVEGAISYTGNVADKNRKPYTLDYYLELARKLVDLNIHILCIKDMAGLLTVPSARLLIGALRKEFPDMPIHVHTHDTGCCAVSAMLAAAEAGADIVDACMDSMSGLTSQPSMGAIVQSTKFTPFDTQLDLNTLSQFSDYFEQVRRYYSPFDCTTTLKSGSADVYVHEIPGGQYTNLHMQAWSMGMGDKWPQIKTAYTQANTFLGNPPKVTPSSKVVGDLAQMMVQNNLTDKEVYEKAEKLSFPSSVVEYFKGYIGQPPFGWDEKLREKILKNVNKNELVNERPGKQLKPIDFEAVRHRLEEQHARKFSDAEVVSSVMYPSVFDDYQDFLKKFGDVSILPTANFFTGAYPGEDITVNMAGREVLIKYIARTHVLADGTRDVFFDVMGFPRTVNIKDKTATETVKSNLKADISDPKQIGAPMPGNILCFKVKENDTINKGDPLVIIAAMKMETVVVSPCQGVVASIYLKDGDAVESADLLIKLK